MPFDENLFESNQMMKDYWNRSTSERAIDYARDVVHEETALPEDGEAAVYQELRQLSEQSYRPQSAGFVARPSVPLADSFAATDSFGLGAVVQPKSRAASGTNGLIVAGVAVAALLVVLFFGGAFNPNSEARQATARGGSPRGSPSRSRRV